MANVFSMGMVLDLIVIAIISVAVVIARKRGFVKTVVEFAGFFVAVILAFNLSSVLAEATYDNWIRRPVIDSINSSISGVVTETGENAADAIWNAIPSFITDNAEAFNISKEQLSEIVDVSNISTGDAVAKATDQFVKPVALTVISAILSIVIFLLVALVFKLLAKPLNALFSAIPVVGTLNKVLGVVLGFGNGIVISVIFCAVILCIIAFNGSGFLIFTKDNIDSSYLFKLLCKLSPMSM